MNSLAVLCHTFNRYEHLWDGFLEGWQKHNPPSSIDMFLGTDTPGHGRHKLGQFNYLYSGEGEWSDRLLALLQQIDYKYVLYTQEDMWPTRQMPNVSWLMRAVEEGGLLRLQISTVNQFYSLYGDTLPLLFHQKSKYLVSHQPSIWQKDFLVSCLESGETPWTNEYAGSQRVSNRADVVGKIGIYPCGWYKHKCVKGQVVD